MLIFHHGHSEFLLELADGYRILTDPFDAHVGYPMRRVRCDAVTVSHAHGDHSEVGKAENYTALVDYAGTTVLAAVQEGYEAVGIEMSDAYFRRSAERLKTALAADENAE